MSPRQTKEYTFQRGKGGEERKIGLGKGGSKGGKKKRIFPASLLDKAETKKTGKNVMTWSRRGGKKNGKFLKEGVSRG